LRAIQVSFPAGDANAIERTQNSEGKDRNGEDWRRGQVRQHRHYRSGREQGPYRNFFRGQGTPDQTEGMVDHKIGYGQRTYDRAYQERRPRGRLPDHVSIEPSHQRNRRDPDLAMAQAKILTQRPRQIRFQRSRVCEPIGQVNQPRGQEKRDDIPGLQRKAKRPREQPEPRDRYERRIEANEVQPNGGDGALRRPRTCGFLASFSRTPQRGVPTIGILADGLPNLGMRLLSFQSILF